MIDQLPFLVQGVIMFLCQLIFVWARTVNVIANSNLNRFEVMWSGIVVHISWLLSLYIGLGNLFNGNPMIVLFSLSGGLLGADYALRQKIKRKFQ